MSFGDGNTAGSLETTPKGARGCGIRVNFFSSQSSKLRHQITWNNFYNYFQRHRQTVALKGWKRTHLLTFVLVIILLSPFVCQLSLFFALFLSDLTFISDINECTAVPRICSHFCDNLFSSFRCLCPGGYTLSSDNKTCDGTLVKNWWSGGITAFHLEQFPIGTTRQSGLSGSRSAESGVQRFGKLGKMRSGRNKTRLFFFIQ